MRKKVITLLHILLLVTGCASSSSLTQSDPGLLERDTVNQSITTSDLATITSLTYPIVDSGQGKCYDNNSEINCVQVGVEFFGQDAQYAGNTPRYQDNGDGTITDHVTDLMWQQDPGEKKTYDQAVADAFPFSLAGYNDWRLPTIKELYSLILFDGTDVSGCNGTCDVTPFIDTRYFIFSYGDTSIGERVIDSQFISSTKYVSTTMKGEETVFGVNFADGRIKGYGTGPMMGGVEDKTFYAIYVRGNTNYGKNSFVDNRDGTIADNATGLTWTQSDSGVGMEWEAALSYCGNLELAGAEDWRLPNIKELQSIVNYSRSPSTTNSAAIDSIFGVTAITNEAGRVDYPYYWSSTTHADSSGHGAYAAYVAFGEALGYMGSNWIDVHGAGAQRSDPKTGNASLYPEGHGPQGDAIRIDNYVRCVRGGNVTDMLEGGPKADRPMMTVDSVWGQQTQGDVPQALSQTPPAEAMAACAGSMEGASCSFSTPNRTIIGTCHIIQQQLACVPVRNP